MPYTVNPVREVVMRIVYPRPTRKITKNQSNIDTSEKLGGRQITKKCQKNAMPQK